LRNDAASYVFKDYGPGAFGDFEIDYDINQLINSSGANHQHGIVVLSNSIGTLDDLLTADGIAFCIGRAAGSWMWKIINLQDSTNNSTLDFDFIFLDYSENIYFRASRTGSSALLKVYSNSNRATHIVSYDITLPVSTTRYKYLYALCSADAFPGSADLPSNAFSMHVKRLKILSYG